MDTKGTKLALTVGIPLVLVLLGGVAGAESNEASGATAPEGQSGSAASELDNELRQEQDAALKTEVGNITEVASQLRDARDSVGAAAERTRELEEQTRHLTEQADFQRLEAAKAQDRLKERARVAYKGEDVAGVFAVVQKVFDEPRPVLDAIAEGPLARVLTQDRRSIETHKDAERALKETLRQAEETRAEQEEPREEERSRAGELKRREGKLKASTSKLGTDKEQRIEERIEQLEVAEEAGEIQLPPASGNGNGGVGMGADRELDIAREQIVAQPVEEIPYKRYLQIYKAAAKRYGFAEDWYVLAAVGKVESNHGENMGPSTAGAMGPMQFLPSTWQQFGVDGNQDGVANILDPEDAIPAAASYLEYGGAPEDFYAALYTYNRAGWYVREVLGIAEGYRRLAKDDEVDPYV
ncbi:MAG: GH23 [uncultured Rubrobacteraceae bacterium]|uniref:GH23 n=1 Tax=uncultured Rubrobacteraceae bacterium TaxID=349277 RepID=A0A6J4QKM1_9ACTN|nr:MAG: GH23 [uncultured Rubrobacteraceae bacterium]